MTPDLRNCENTMLSEIGNKGIKQKDLALTYALAMRSEERTDIDWKKVNKAIIERWSMSGLERIKKMAWNVVK